MLFETLPTELGDRILALLDHDALNAMSQISKMYRCVTEPFLYRHLILTTSHEMHMRWLVVTLLNRPSLAAHVRSIEFLEDDRTRDNAGPRVEKTNKPPTALEQAFDKLHQTIVGAIGSDTSKAELRVTWLGAILTDDHVEGSLALIVYLAHNAESLIVMDEVRKGVITGYHGELLTKVMWEVFDRYYSNPSEPCPSILTPRGSSRPFSRLQELHLKTLGATRIITLPYLRKLRIERCDEISVSHKFPTGASHHLRTLEIVDTYCSARSIQRIFTERHATELRRLVLQKFCATPDTSCQPIVDALVENCNKLEYLELDLHLWFEVQEKEKPLQGFCNLKSLSTLRVDIDTLVSSEERTRALPDLDGLLPQDLGALHITGVSEFELWALLNLVLDSDVEQLCVVAELRSIRVLSITIDLDDDWEDEWTTAVPTLILIAQRLWSDRAVIFEVYRSAQSIDMEPVLLIDREGSHEEMHSLEGLDSD